MVEPGRASEGADKGECDEHQRETCPPCRARCKHCCAVQPDQREDASDGSGDPHAVDRRCREERSSRNEGTDHSTHAEHHRNDTSDRRARTLGEEINASSGGPQQPQSKKRHHALLAAQCPADADNGHHQHLEVLRRDA